MVQSGKRRLACKCKSDDSWHTQYAPTHETRVYRTPPLCVQIDFTYITAKVRKYFK